MDGLDILAIINDLIDSIGLFYIIKAAMGDWYPYYAGAVQYPYTRGDLNIVILDLISNFKELDSSEFTIYNVITDTYMDKNTTERAKFMEWLTYLEEKSLFFSNKEAFSCYDDLLLIKKHI
jgi:hypothetical protein